MPQLFEVFYSFYGTSKQCYMKISEEKLSQSPIKRRFVFDTPFLFSSSLLFILVLPRLFLFSDTHDAIDTARQTGECVKRNDIFLHMLPSSH